MDDPTKNPQPQHPTQQPVSDTTQVVSSVAPLAPPPAPAAPVGGMNKEAGPVMVQEQPVAEVLTPSEAEPILHPEVQEAGVEVSKNPEVPDLTIHDKKAGVEHAPVIAPIPTHPSGTVQLPIPEEQAIAQAKIEKNPKKSISWYLRAIIRQYLIGKEKETGGH